MKKMYVLTLLSMCFAGMSMAQEVATAVTVNNWDGSPLVDNTLYIGVGETKELNFTTEPENADKSTVRLGITMGNDGEIYVAFQEFNLIGSMEGEAWVYIYSTVLKEQTEEGEEERDKQIGGPVRVICSNYMASGEFWYEGAVEPGGWAIDLEGKLFFWADGGSADNPFYQNLSIPDYRVASSTPWYEYRELVKSIELGNVDTIGMYAFNDMINLKTLSIPWDVKFINSYAFLGCSNLKSMTVERYYEQEEGVVVEEPMITMTSGDALIIDNSSPNFPVRVGAIVIWAEMEDAVVAYKSADYEWSLCHVVSGMSWDENAEYRVEITDNGEIELRMDSWGEGADAEIGDRQEGQTYPWDDFGETAIALYLSGNYSYIGNGAFDQLSGLRKIQIEQDGENNILLGSIHAGAFSESITPWKFAFGEPMNGPIIPPTVVIPEGQTERNVIENWRHIFGDSTVLYVPDSTFEHNGEMVRSIDLYRNHPIWGQVFNCLTDRTVKTAPAGNNTDVLLEWMPLEGMTNYRLTVRKIGCDTCDQVIDIPALSERGTVDWSMIKIEAAQGRRAPMSNDGGGGLTLTIQPGSGMMHNSSMNVSVGGLEEEGEYEFTREAFLLGWTESDPEYTDEGSFTMADATAIEKVESGKWKVESQKAVYDILGRKMGTSLETLPEGLYIYDNGTERTKIMLRR